MSKHRYLCDFRQVSQFLPARASRHRHFTPFSVTHVTRVAVCRPKQNDLFFDTTYFYNGMQCPHSFLMLGLGILCSPRGEGGAQITLLFRPCFSSTGLHAADSFFPGLNFVCYISTNGAETSVRLKKKIISAHLVSEHPQNK